MSTVPLSVHLPDLPLEVQHHILRFCDPSTLATTSLVSLAFLELELSSPILYQDIEIVGLKNVEKLFCPRDQSLDHSHLYPHLSLTHVRNLTVVATSEIGGVLNLSSSRFPPPSSSLPIDLLVLRPVGFKTLEAEEFSISQWSSILSLLDPTSVRVVGQEIKPSSRLPTLDLTAAPWFNVVCLSTSQTTYAKSLGRSVFATSSTLPVTVVFVLPLDWKERQAMTVGYQTVTQLGPRSLKDWDEKKLKVFVVELGSQDSAKKVEQ